LNILISIFILTFALPAFSQLPEFSKHKITSNDGHFVLSWVSDSPVVLYEKNSGNWKKIYQGTDTATTISGKPDGIYIYVLQNDGGKGTEMSVSVSHHSPFRTAFFFATGLFVFLATVFLILKGNNK